jgi:tRNA-dihydrouridine synthase 1
LRSEWESYGKYPICLAPMVDMCDIAFRILCRRHGVACAWTGMINSNSWNASKTYRKNQVDIDPEDRPLVLQMSGAVDTDLLSAAKGLAEFGFPVDINLGCCQRVAKRGEYGYFMVNTEEKRMNVLEVVSELVKNLNVPLYAKIRELTDADGTPSEEITVEFAKQLEKAGVALITIHGRPASQDKNGPVDINLVKAIASSVKIPVIANGGINTLEDAKRIIDETGAIAAMSAQALLYDPSAFDPNGRQPKCKIAREYLEICKKFPKIPFDVIRRHFFYFFDNELGSSGKNRATLGMVRDFEGLEKFIVAVEENRVSDDKVLDL